MVVEEIMSGSAPCTLIWHHRTVRGLSRGTCIGTRCPAKHKFAKWTSRSLLALRRLLSVPLSGQNKHHRGFRIPSGKFLRSSPPSSPPSSPGKFPTNSREGTPSQYLQQCILMMVGGSMQTANQKPFVRCEPGRKEMKKFPPSLGHWRIF